MIALPLAMAAPAIAAPLRSGLYEELVLAVAPSGRVVGHYREDQGDGPTKSCAFTLTGAAAGGSVTARSDAGGAALQGQLTATPRGVKLTLPHGRDLPGCGLVLMPEIDTGVDLDRVGDGRWSELVRVSVPRAGLRQQPDAAPGRSYVIRGDVLGVVARRGTSVDVVYPSIRPHPSQGWIEAAEVTPLAR